MPIATDSDGFPDIGGKSNYAKPQRRIVLCFDGTGNTFQGNTSDTNIVKMLSMLDHTSPTQKHYYQPGIGTYTADGVVNRSLFGKIQAYFSETLDAGLATSFDQHVMSGYRFLMRFYDFGDQIYLFGFSRGAFTARFLARLIAGVGLLSSGNEEMVPFAYKVYQDYETAPNEVARAKALEYMKTFRSTFCCHESDLGTGIKAHFLGLFDTVNSVGTFDLPFSSTNKLATVQGTARHVRHAVAIDERRVKFKASLLEQDVMATSAAEEDIKEVWFPGNHGDVGGGWPAEREEHHQPLSLWTRFKRFLFVAKDTQDAHSDKTDDLFQLSDIPLKWMIDEIDGLPSGAGHLDWNVNHKQDFLDRFEKSREEAVKARLHDVMAFGKGSGFGMALFWKFMEYLPIIKRWEYYHGQGWQYTRFPLNCGNTRDIPPNARFHRSVLERFRIFPRIQSQKSKENKTRPYLPPNDIHLSAPGAETQKTSRQWKLRHTAATLCEVNGDRTPLLERSVSFVQDDPNDQSKVTDRIYRLTYDE